MQAASAKPSKFNSFQERMIGQYTKRFLGNQLIFYPSEYGNSKEPADLAWVINRCAILFYATRSKKKFAVKVKHNLRQAERWLKKWRGGKLLTSVGTEKSLSFRFDDIQCILIISVIGGDQSYATYHADFVDRMASLKVCVCVSLPGQSLKLMAKAGFTPRDSLLLFDLLRREGRREFEYSAVRQMIWFLRGAFWKIAQQNLVDVGPGRSGNVGSHSFRTSLQGFLDFDHSSDLTALGADLTMANHLAISETVARLEASLAPPGRYGAVRLSSEIKIAGINAIIDVFASTNVISPDILKEISARASTVDLYVLSFNDLGSPQRMTVIGRYEKQLLADDLTNFGHSAESTG